MARQKSHRRSSFPLLLSFLQIPYPEKIRDMPKNKTSIYQIKEFAEKNLLRYKKYRHSYSPCEVNLVLQHKKILLFMSCATNLFLTTSWDDSNHAMLDCCKKLLVCVVPRFWVVNATKSISPSTRFLWFVAKFFTV